MRPGDLFADRYEIRDILGEGGTATVYRAFDAVIQREVALKIIDLGADSENARARFRREVQILGSLRGAHTVQLYEHGVGNSSLWLVTELVPGRDLEEELRLRGALPESDAVHVLRQVLRALHEAHEHGLIDRDIKPDNIRVYEYMGDPFYAKLIDFGIARSTATDRSIVTREGNWLGTPQFMSPEQILGQELDARSDVYSLGVVAFEMLTGRPAILGADAAAAFAQQMNRSLVLPPDLPISAELRAIVHRMVDKDRSRRFGSAAEILQHLGPVSSGAISSPVAASRPASDKRREPSGVGVAVLAGVATVILVGGGLALLSADDEPPPRVAVQNPKPAPSVEPEPAPEVLPVPPVEPVDAQKTQDVGVPVDTSVAVELEPLEFELSGASAGCDGEGGGRKLEGQAFLGQADAKWTLKLPDDYDGKSARPLMLMVTELERSPNKEANDSGIHEQGAARGWITATMKRASTLDRFMPHKNLSLWEESELVAAVLFDIAANACVDLGGLHVLGVSAGATVAELVPRRIPLAGLAIVSWRLSDAADLDEPRHPVPTIVLTGDADPGLPKEGTTRSCSGGGAVVSAEESGRILAGLGECTDASSTSRGGVCRRFDTCDAAPMEFCEFEGGFGWRQNSRTAANIACTRGSTAFPTMKTVFDFFEEQPRPNEGEKP